METALLGLRARWTWGTVEHEGLVVAVAFDNEAGDNFGFMLLVLEDDCSLVMVHYGDGVLVGKR